MVFHSCDYFKDGHVGETGLKRKTMFSNKTEIFVAEFSKCSHPIIDR